jgi:hypothetical protein
LGPGIQRFLKNLCGSKWISGIQYVSDMGMLAKMEYLIGLKQLIKKKKKKVDRSETLLWMVVRSSIYFYGLVRESTLHFQMNCEMHWRDMISVRHPSASQFFWVDGF